MSSHSKERRICPRCGEPYSYVEKIDIGERSYLYAVHYYVDENDIQLSKPRLLRRGWVLDRYAFKPLYRVI